MKCYVFKVRSARYRSKKDDKEKRGFNVGLVALEGAKFHLETFIDERDNVFDKSNIRDNSLFKAGFWDIDIDEFEVYTPNGSQYQKKIIKIIKKLSLEDCKCYLDI